MDLACHERWHLVCFPGSTSRMETDVQIYEILEGKKEGGGRTAPCSSCCPENCFNHFFSFLDTNVPVATSSTTSQTDLVRKQNFCATVSTVPPIPPQLAVGAGICIEP